ncbi:MAG: capsular polysaccharide biosynthesis protein [Ruminococcus flavefaciens]|nr:capsular polysaccharide biosynthesis protein [Ruminococcus flavefaciens]MCM1229938.1 capsular polysaccharide biosynthesis protein [Ruminococcus flavefaciens]
MATITAIATDMDMATATASLLNLKKMIKTDYHCHILPAMDDGAEDCETSGKMLDMMSRQGIENIVLTPHFYMHKEKSVDGFLQRREASFANIKDRKFSFYQGAEVAVERGLCELPGIEKLAVQGTDLILLELPFSNIGRWVNDEIHNIACETGLKPVLAHIHRYTDIFSKADLNRLIDSNVIMQVNTELLRTFGGRIFMNKLIKSGSEIVFGSDAHNLSDRKPDYTPLKKLKDELLVQSDEILQQHIKKVP